MNFKFVVLVFLFGACAVPEVSLSSGTPVWINDNQVWCLTDGDSKACLDPTYRLNKISKGFVEFRHDADGVDLTIVEYSHIRPFDQLAERFPADVFDKRIEDFTHCIGKVGFVFRHNESITKDVIVMVLLFPWGATISMSGADLSKIEESADMFRAEWQCGH